LDHDVRNWRRRVWKLALKACELNPGTVPYDLRHSFASLLIHEKRLSIVEIADQLGHAPTMTSNTYGHVMRELRGTEAVSAEEQIRRARARVSGMRRAS
jgi:integrase